MLLIILASYINSCTLFSTQSGNRITSVALFAEPAVLGAPNPDSNKPLTAHTSVVYDFMAKVRVFVNENLADPSRCLLLRHGLNASSNSLSVVSDAS